MLDELLLGKGDIDVLSVAIASLFAHHYQHRLDKLLAFVRAKPRYFTFIFLAILCTHESVQTYVKSRLQTNPAKLDTFMRVIRSKLSDVVQNTMSVHVFNENAYMLWQLS